MLTERLRGLEVAPLRFHLETGREFRVPIYKGAVFRGGFGQLFRDLACVTRAPTCSGCPHLATCGYSVVFETPVASLDHPVLSKYPNAPHPFVLTPPLDARTVVPEGSKLTLDLTLVGPARRWLPHFLFVFDQMGRQGRYGGPYRIERVTGGVDGRLVFDGAKRLIVDDPAPVIWTDTARTAGRAQIEFLTPLRMRTGGDYNERPDFVAFVHAVLGRLHLLTAIYGGQTADRGWMRELLARADGIRTVEQNFQVLRQDRTSGRQHRKVPMDGVMGRMVVEGDLGPLEGVLAAGEWLHAGSGTSMGLGKYRVWWGG